MAVVDDLPVDEPTKVTLLGDDLIVWRATDGTWAAAADACPHRLAPLSAGRVEGGVLACSYHGWEFEGSGVCTRIPQPCSGRGAEGAAVAASSPRACLRTRVTRVAQGMLWVWGDDGETAEVDAAAASPTLIPGISADDPTLADDGSPLLYMGQYMRADVPCSWTALTANGLDASHLDFAHTAVIGDKDGPFAGVVTHANVKDGDDAAASGRPFGAAASVRAKATAAATGDASVHDVTFPLPDRDESVRGKNMATQRITFEPPVPVNWALDAPSDISRGSPWRTLAILVTPTRPGFCSVFFCMAFPKQGANFMARAIFGTLPRWKLHLLGADVFDGDVALLAPTDAAPAAIAAAAASDDYAAWTRANYVPADADEPVRALYKWLATRAGGGPFGVGETASAVSDPLAAHAAMSRRGHLTTCRECREMHARSEQVACVASVAALLLAAVAAGAAGARAPAAAVARWAAGAAVTAIVATLAARRAAAFVKEPYNHSCV